MQHQHLRATLDSYLNARNIMAKEFFLKVLNRINLFWG